MHVSVYVLVKWWCVCACVPCVCAWVMGRGGVDLPAPCTVSLQALTSHRQQGTHTCMLVKSPTFPARPCAHSPPTPTPLHPQIAAGAHLDVADFEGLLPLHQAACTGNVELARLLVGCLGWEGGARGCMGHGLVGEGAPGRAGPPALMLLTKHSIFLAVAPCGPTRGGALCLAPTPMPSLRPHALP